MADTISNSLTMIDIAKRKDPDGTFATIAEILNKNNPIVQDMPLLMANDTWNHKMVRRSSLPIGSWRRINAGVAKERSDTTEVLESIGMLESYSEIDKALIDSAPNGKQARMDEASPFLEGMSQTLAETFFYGDHDLDPEKFDGLSKRMGSLDADNLVIGQGGTGDDNTSIYVVIWGRAQVFGIYPKGTDGANIVKHDDLGEVTLQDANGNNFQGYRDHFFTKVGLAVKDPRCIGRLANIEPSGTTNTFDENNLITMLNRMPGDGAGAVIYVNDTIKTQMEIALKAMANVNFSTDNGLGGVPVLRFRGIPVKKCEAILNTETTIS